jgi:hypothetical protein
VGDPFEELEGSDWSVVGLRYSCRRIGPIPNCVFVAACLMLLPPNQSINQSIRLEDVVD